MKLRNEIKNIERKAEGFPFRIFEWNHLLSLVYNLLKSRNSLIEIHNNFRPLNALSNKTLAKGSLGIRRYINIKTTLQRWKCSKVS